MAKIIKNVDIQNIELDSEQTLWTYCALDCAVTHRSQRVSPGCLRRRDKMFLLPHWTADSYGMGSLCYCQ